MAMLAQELARLLDARERCMRSDASDSHKEWAPKHTQAALDLVKAHMPSGSGWDMGTRLDLDESSAEKLVFHGAFHHMNQNGFYDGWTEHTVTVRASLAFTLDIKVSGRDRNDIKDYLHECFDVALRQEVQR